MSESREATKDPTNDHEGGFSAPGAGSEDQKKQDVQLLAELLSRTSRDQLEAALRLVVARKRQVLVPAEDELRKTKECIERSNEAMVEAMIEVVGSEKAAEVVAEYGQRYSAAEAGKVVA